VSAGLTMGVVRLLCITIAFAFLATVAAQDCSGVGAIKNGRCVCLSGNAGTQCEIANAGACSASVNQPQQLHDNYFPNLVQTQDGSVVNDPLIIAFTNNILSLNINGELVQGRNYTDINFINNLNPATPVTDTRCSLNGGATSFWTQSNLATELTQTVSAKTKYVYRCGDLFSLSMPWNQHQFCGFAANPAYELPSQTYHQYEAIIKITYDDVFAVTDVDDQSTTVATTMTRHASASYTIHVQFTKIVLVEVENVVAFSQVNLTVVLTQFEYNPADSSATMTFASIVRYPHIVVRNFTTIEIPHQPQLSFGAGSGNTDASQPYLVWPETDPTVHINPTTDICIETPNADRQSGQNCLERFTTKVYLGAGLCNFDGTYVFGGLVSTCRDEATYRSCPSEMQYVGLKLSNSGVCGSVTAEPQVTGELVAFSDEGMTHKTNEFLVGSRAYFTAKINTRNSFHLKWLDIFTISMDDVTMSDLADRIPSVTDLTYSRPAYGQYFVKDARLQYGGFRTSSHPAGDATFDSATFPNGPIDLVGWQSESPLNGSLTDGAVVMGPNFNFRWDGAIFTPVPGQKKVYNVIAKAQLTFEGNEAENRKREVKIVDFVYKPETSGMTASVVCDLSESNEVAPANEAVTSSSINMVAVKAAVPVAGVALVVVAVAVIAAVVIVRRKKSSATFRTLN